MTKTIMLIHGAWLNAQSWEGFKARYEAKGYTVVAPSWPLDDRAPAELRANPHPDLKNVGMVRIHRALRSDIIRALPEAADPDRPFVRRHDHAASARSTGWASPVSPSIRRRPPASWSAGTRSSRPSRCSCPGAAGGAS